MVAPKRRSDLSPRSGIRTGRNPGHVTTRRDPVDPARRFGLRKKKISAVRNLCWEVTGFAPYERRVIQLLTVQRDKRALRFLKRRLGTHKRALVKREKLAVVLREQQSRAKTAAAAAGTTTTA